MADNSSGPLSASLFRTLTDKLYEKRKAGALEIEKMIREQLSTSQVPQMEKVVEFLGELARSQNAHYRKGGLIGLAAAAIAMGKLASNYTDKLILPVLESFNDADSRIRYYACEALYNIVKITRESTLAHFKTVFDTLARSASDADQNVRNGAELLDRLLKDIVTNCTTFQVGDFMCYLRERIYTKNSNTRRFLVSWVQILYNVPQINLVPYLPEVLDGFFHILSDNTQRTRESCETVLGEFLRNIAKNPKEADLQHMVNVLIVHAQSSDDLVQLIALIWLRDFLAMDGLNMLRSASGYLTAILPCLAYGDDEKKNIRETAITVNDNLMKLITVEDTAIETILDFQSIVLVLQTNLGHDSVQTRVAVLRWIHHLYKKMPAKTFPYMEELFPILLQLLSDTSDEVVLLDLEVLSDVCSNVVTSTDKKISIANLPLETQQALRDVSPYFVKFIMSLLDVFRADVKLLVDRGSFIIRQLCVLLKPDDIFRTLAILLTLDKDLQFVWQMVQILNSILLTATELFTLRSQLKEFKNEKSIDLFICLYKCWVNQPVALIALCLLTRNYIHASHLIQIFSELEITVEFLTEIDKLIQLLESPIFTYLRLQLLDPVYQPYLATVLYGLLMLLPQTEAFHTLHRRLQSLPHAVTPAIDRESHMTAMDGIEDGKPVAVDFGPLLVHFRNAQERHKLFRRQKHREFLTKTP